MTRPRVANRTPTPALQCLALTLIVLAGCDPGEQAGGEAINATEMNATDAADAADNASAPATGPRKPCAVTGTRETEADCEELAGGLTGLKAGIDAFRPTQPMGFFSQSATADSRQPAQRSDIFIGRGKRPRSMLR